jgi:hypothetical protein
VRVHLLDSRKQTASPAASEQIILIHGLFCDDFGEGKGSHLVLL